MVSTSSRILSDAPRREGGFTLLELVVAMSLFAVLSTMAYTGLDSVLRARERSTEQLDRLAELRLSLLLFGRDVEQAAPRPIRDQYGDTQPALVGAGGLELTRAGWRNPLGRPRGQLQRVVYRIEDEKLVRLSWSVLDRAQDSEPRRTVLLERVRDLELRYLDAEGDWRGNWPKADDRDAAPDELPRALELTLDLEDWGRIVRLYRVSSWVRPPSGPGDGGADGDGELETGAEAGPPKARREGDEEGPDAPDR